MAFAGWRRPLAVMMAALVGTSGCTAYRWKVVPLKELDVAEQRLLSRRVRLQTAQGTVDLQVERVVHPYVEGRVERGGGPVQVDLRRTHALELFPRPTDTDRNTRTLAATAERLAAEPLAGRTVRLHTDRGSVKMTVDRAEWPWVHGPVQGGIGTVALDLRQVTGLQIRETDVPLALGKSVLAVAGAALIAMLLVALTKESCPIVYVDRGQGFELVGEAYAGAAFRSIQRDDLLPVAPLDDQASLRVRLRNEARETQYTDRAELVVVDHDEDVRVVSTFDGRLVAVEAPAAAERATDLRGRDVHALLAAKDGRPWQADLAQAARERGVPLREGIVAEFAAAHSSAVLELVGGNTDWLDLAFGRFFAAMGDRLPRYLATGNDPASGARIRRWREREGVDLAVDLWRGRAWQRVAIVPTVGPVAMRHVAIPVAASGGGPLRIRLSGGLGFWRIDHIALAAQAPSRPEVTVVRPRSARGPGGADQLAALASSDGNYDALENIGDSLDLDFDLPPRPAGMRRFAFLLTNGYYNVHPPPQSRWLPGTLRALRDKPGSLARMAVELARAYSEPVAAGAAQ